MFIILDCEITSDSSEPGDAIRSGLKVHFSTEHLHPHLLCNSEHHQSRTSKINISSRAHNSINATSKVRCRQGCFGIWGRRHYSPLRAKDKTSLLANEGIFSNSLLQRRCSSIRALALCCKGPKSGFCSPAQQSKLRILSFWPQ